MTDATRTSSMLATSLFLLTGSRSPPASQHCGAPSTITPATLRHTMQHTGTPLKQALTKTFHVSGTHEPDRTALSRQSSAGNAAASSSTSRPITQPLSAMRALERDLAGAACASTATSVWSLPWRRGGDAPSCRRSSLKCRMRRSSTATCSPTAGRRASLALSPRARLQALRREHK